MLKCKIYSDKKDNSKIFRVISICKNGKQALVVNCKTRQLSYESSEFINSLEQISEEEMIKKTVGHIPSYESLTLKEKKVVNDRYNVISELLNLEDSGNLYKEVARLCSKYKMSNRTILKWTRLYYAYARKEVLLPHFNSLNRDDSKLDVSSKIIYQDRNKIINEYGKVLIYNAKLMFSINSQPIYVQFAVDTFSNCILSHHITNVINENSYISLINTLFSNGNRFPNKIVTSVNDVSWNGLKKFCQFGVELTYSNLTNKYIDRVTNKINKFVFSSGKVITNKELKKILEKYVEESNKTLSAFNLSCFDLHLEASLCFKDSYLANSSFEGFSSCNSLNYPFISKDIFYK